MALRSAPTPRGRQDVDVWVRSHGEQTLSTEVWSPCQEDHESKMNGKKNNVAAAEKIDDNKSVSGLQTLGNIQFC
ncbi:Hypothetical protein SMAX5B_016546, partial [Scophthalmus maximus]